MAQHRRARAAQQLSKMLRSNGWEVKEQPDVSTGASLFIHRGMDRFVVELKAVAESRPDRVIPMLALGVLQAKAAARTLDAAALAIVHVPDISSSLTRQVEAFALDVAGNISVGLIADDGSGFFHGAAFQELNRPPDEHRRPVAASGSSAVNLFSDLNQWMLKLLLAAELPQDLLDAPRRKYRNGTELAEAAQASAMSASRFLAQLRKEGYLDDSAVTLKLVRREELFRRWSAAVTRSAREMPCRFLLRAPVPTQLRVLLAKQKESACLGLFAAADALNVGHVSGVPPHVYVRKLPTTAMAEWPGLLPYPAEKPDLILRQAQFPLSTFQGALIRNDFLVTDIIQTWLDVAQHPARGVEQANLIYTKFIHPLVSDRVHE